MIQQLIDGWRNGRGQEGFHMYNGIKVDQLLQPPGFVSAYDGTYTGVQQTGCTVLT